MSPTENRNEPRESRASSTTSSRVFFFVGIAVVVAYVSGALGPMADFAFLALSAASFVACIVGLRRYRPAVLWPWITVMVAQVVFLAGNVARFELHTTGDLTSHRSMIPDWIFLPAYLMLVAAIQGLGRARRRGRGGDFDAMLDGAVAGLAALTVSWVFIVNPALLDLKTPLQIRLTLTAYPAIQVFIVALAARLLFSADSRRLVAFHTIMATTVAGFVGDLNFVLVEAHKAFLPARLTDIPSALSIVFMGTTLLHPSMRHLTEPVPTQETAPRTGRLAFVALALLVPAAVVMWRPGTTEGDRIVLAVIVVTLTATAITRVFRALRAHAAAERRLTLQVTHDSLTGLPNRAHILEDIAAARSQNGHESSTAALLFLDLDRFKLVNDTFGHRFGDELLIAVARRLEAAVRPGDIVGRIGGDEYVVLLPSVTNSDEALDVAERVRLSFLEPFEIRGSEMPSSCSIGVAVMQDDDDDSSSVPENLLRDADTAMYEAKSTGRDTVVAFDTDMRERVKQRVAIERDLRHALERDELQVFYQPLVTLPGRKVYGFEALLRWIHPTSGMVSPLTFIPVAEETGMIVEIGAWVIREGCRQLAWWRRVLTDGEDLRLSINLSARQLRDPELIATVEKALLDNELPASAICLEITESVLMDNPQAAELVLQQIKAMGIRLSIDDFGTGYSSLAYLSRFDVDQVKIDRCFVDGLENPETSQEGLVTAIIAMSNALGLTTVGEGVETEEQAVRLAELGCGSGQGFYFARPMSADLVPEALENVEAVRLERLQNATAASRLSQSQPAVW
jgi:diguanylate cyclase (GGDEF)-like protein